MRYVPKRLRGRKPLPQRVTLPKARLLLVEACKLLWAHRKAFAGILAVYAIGMLLLVVGFSASSNFASVRDAVNESFAGKGWANSVAIQVYFLFSNSNAGTSQLSGIYQSILLVLVSLALIWGLRQAKSGKRFKAKDSFYAGMSPLIPFLLTIAVISIQLLPLSIGAYLYSTLTTYGIVVYWYEQFLAFAIFMGFAYWSLRMVTGSIFSPYIATLPGMLPVEAVRNAKELVRGRRLVIWRKLIYLPIVLVVAIALLVTPFVMFLNVLAPWVFFLLGTVAFAVTHAYLYTLYRELIREK